MDPPSAVPLCSTLPTLARGQPDRSALIGPLPHTHTYTHTHIHTLTHTVSHRHKPKHPHTHIHEHRFSTPQTQTPSHTCTPGMEKEGEKVGLCYTGKVVKAKDSYCHNSRAWGLWSSMKVLERQGTSNYYSARGGRERGREGWSE